jgi:hypothetical protein
VPDSLHFFLDGDICKVEEARRSDNVSMFFVSQLRNINRDIARADASQSRSHRR